MGFEVHGSGVCQRCSFAGHILNLVSQLSPGCTHRALLQGFTLLQGIGGYSTTPWVLPEFLDTPRAAMIKMVYSTGDLRLPV